MNEGQMDWEHGRTWYRIDGRLDGDGPAPLVILHGGPGAAHDYLEPLAVLSERTGRACVLYDQLGCGRSQHLPHVPTDFWSAELFVTELDALLDHLGIAGRYHLLGQSWGGMLAMEHAVRQPTGLQSVVIANSPASMPLWVQETGRLRSLLPDDVQEVLTRHETAGTTGSDEYEAAVLKFYERHLCRIVPFPECLQRTFDQMDEDPTVYHAMNGPSEFHVIGWLRELGDHAAASERSGAGAGHLGRVRRGDAGGGRAAGRCPARGAVGAIRGGEPFHPPRAARPVPRAGHVVPG